MSLPAEFWYALKNPAVPRWWRRSPPPASGCPRELITRRSGSARDESGTRPWEAGGEASKQLVSQLSHLLSIQPQQQPSEGSRLELDQGPKRLHGGARRK